MAASLSRFSVAIPVKNGARYLREVLTAAHEQGSGEILVIDSGSEDGSVDIARHADARVLEIEPHQFGHGRTRNLAMQATHGDFVAFLTQDATPCHGWLNAYAEVFALDERVGAAFGPHLPRAGTSPMIARELTEFFASFSPDSTPRVQRRGDPSFLSNVNACYARSCWEDIRFRDVPYAEDQAFGADLLSAGWLKVYAPAAAVLHSHDYGWSEFMRRYFDEYRGLHSTTGHVEGFDLRSILRGTAAEVAADRRWLQRQGVQGREADRWLVRGVAHHGGRRIFAALGSRAASLPRPVRVALSLEMRGDAGASGPVPFDDGEPGPVRGVPVPATRTGSDYEPVLRVWRDGPAPLRPTPVGAAEQPRLRIAMVIPLFDRGSGGHNTLMQILTRLEQRGHICSVWVHDYFGRLGGFWPGVLRHNIREFFAPMQGPAYAGFEQWHGADVVIATGWETAHPVLGLPNCHARTYLVNDHEPEFFATSTESRIAEDTYRHDLHCIAASPWLRDTLIKRYGASADSFQLGVDHAVYRPRDVPRRVDTVVYYARHATPRRAVPVGLMALEELHRRRPDIRIILFGTAEPLQTPFPHEHMGILRPEDLSWLYSEATVGLCLSLTNFSLMPKEMMACGLPCVELAGVSAESIFGSDGPIELVPLNPEHIAASLARLIDGRALWEVRSQAGIEFVASHTWEHATDQVEAGLRHALRLRERAADPAS